MPLSKTYLGIEAVKDRIFNTALILGTLLGSVIYGLSLSSYPRDGFKFTFITDGFIVILLTVIAIYRNRISLKIKSFVILGFLFVLFFEDTILLGVFSANKVLLVLIPFAALMTLSVKETVLISAFIFICYIGLAGLHLAGILVPPSQDTVTLSAWLINIIFIAVVSATVAIIHVGFNKAFSNVISDL
jgi:hypothetical protein